MGTPSVSPIAFERIHSWVTPKSATPSPSTTAVTTPVVVRMPAASTTAVAMTQAASPAEISRTSDNNLVLANPAAMLLTALVDPDTPAEIAGNILRMTLHPAGIKPFVVDWERLATALLHRLEREVAHRPHDERLVAVMDEVTGYPGIAELPGRAVLPDGNDLLVPVHVRLDGVDLRFFTAIATIGAPFDVTLEELRIETLLPADADTEAVLREANDASRGSDPDD